MSQIWGRSPNRGRSRYCTPWMVSLLVQCTYAAAGSSFASSGGTARVKAQSFVVAAMFTWAPTIAPHLRASLSPLALHAPVRT